MSRTIAIGDIHGCSIAFESLINIIDPQPEDLIIPLGDYVDRGIDSKGVLDRLIRLGDRCRLFPIFGNHDVMMIHASVTVVIQEALGKSAGCVVQPWYGFPDKVPTLLIHRLDSRWS